MEKDPLSAWYDGKSPIFKFALKLGGLMFVFYALSVAPFFERAFWPANLHANAWISNQVLRGLRVPTALTGNLIASGNYVFEIKRGCDATEPIFLLAAGMIAFPAPLPRKGVGILAGTVLLLGLNQLRVVALFFVGRDQPGLFPALHLTVFPVVFVILAAVLWVGWVEWIMASRPSNANVATAKT